MKFAIRVDSSPNIGMGHLMRCLALANGLKRRGFEVYFICRDFQGNGTDRIKKNDFNLELLSIKGLELNGTWLGVPYRDDAQDTIDVISENPADWLVVDHYDIDENWEAELRSKFPHLKIMVIDDLVDRRHDCDFLLDQTYGRTEEGYKQLVPPKAKFCLGTEYALLRSDFKELRKQVLTPEKSSNDICHILVTLGGGDYFKPIQVIAKALKKIANDHQFSVTVITGNTPEELLKDFKSLPQKVEYISFSPDISNEMVKADFVIGAGGGTSWERCCLALPTIVLTIADNQIEAVKILSDNKAIIPVSISVDEIAMATKRLIVDDQFRLEMSKSASKLCDGNGVERVVDKILEKCTVV